MIKITAQDTMLAWAIDDYGGPTRLRVTEFRVPRPPRDVLIRMRGRPSTGEAVYVCNYPMYDQGEWAQFMLVAAHDIACVPSSLDLTLIETKNVRSKIVLEIPDSPEISRTNHAQNDYS